MTPASASSDVHALGSADPRRWIWVAAVVGGASYLLAGRLDLPDWAAIAWKGSGVSLLAAWAASHARDRDGWTIALVMAFGALGDVLLETSGLVVGAVAFLAGHLVAITLYLRYRRAALSRSQAMLALLLVPATVVTAFMLPADRAGAPGVAFYSLGLSLMAAAAWTSRFPRLQVGLGALMFVASDLLIFARSGPLHGQAWASVAVWVLYFWGQERICTGVVRALKTAD